MGILKPHRPSDYPSVLLYVLDETHITVTLVTAALVLYTRNAHVAFFAIGATLSSFTAKLVKKFIRSPRPPPPPPTIGTSSARNTHIRPKKTYGMPSTHSTALSFYFFYILPLIPAVPAAYLPSTASKTIAGLGVGGYWAAAVWSRVELGYHTWEQCAGGVALGAVTAGLWRLLWEKNFVSLQSGLQQTIDLVWKESVGRLS